MRPVGAILAVSITLAGFGCGGDGGGTKTGRTHHSKAPVNFDPGFTEAGGTMGITSGCLACHTIDENNGRGSGHHMTGG